MITIPVGVAGAAITVLSYVVYRVVKSERRVHELERVLSNTSNELRLCKQLVLTNNSKVVQLEVENERLRHKVSDLNYMSKAVDIANKTLGRSKTSKSQTGSSRSSHRNDDSWLATHSSAIDDTPTRTSSYSSCDSYSSSSSSDYSSSCDTSSSSCGD